MQHSKDNVNHSQVEEIRQNLSHLPIIQFPETMPDGLEVEADRSRAIYVLEGESEVQEYTYFQQGQFVTKPDENAFRFQFVAENSFRVQLVIN